jgi:glutamate-ammonia-ligase adenylyltransferase
MLDTLVRSDLASPRRSATDLQSELSGLLAASSDFENSLDLLRSFRHQEFLRIALADLASLLELHDVEHELTLLAETVVATALRLAQDEVSTRPGVSHDLALCAVALGRLGAGEMAYNSDLDLIFVYDGAGAGDHETATRIVQKLLLTLEARTREGYAYKIDLRLRPSGNAGPLVSSLKGFIEYHRRSSATWERQALIRSRVVAGNGSLAAKIERARREFVFGKGLSRKEVAEIQTMRLRMQREIGVEDSTRLNLKQGPGGLVDIEFLAQMMALRYGHRHPELQKRSTRQILQAIASAKLMPETDVESLLSHHDFLLRLENRLRIESDQAAWAVPTETSRLNTLAKRLGYKGRDRGERLIQELNWRRVEVRESFNQFFAREIAE